MSKIDVLFRSGVVLDLKRLILNVYIHDPFVNGVLPTGFSGDIEVYRLQEEIFAPLVEAKAIVVVFTSVSFLMEIMDWEKVFISLRDN